MKRTRSYNMDNTDFLHYLKSQITTMRLLYSTFGTFMASEHICKYLEKKEPSLTREFMDGFIAAWHKTPFVKGSRFTYDVAVICMCVFD